MISRGNNLSAGISNVKNNISVLIYKINKVECVFPMAIVSIQSHAEFGPNDHWEDALRFTSDYDTLISGLNMKNQ